MTKKISIIIPTFNHLHDGLIPCLNSIEKFTNLNDVEVIVVANGCKDGTEDHVINNYKWCRLLSFPEPLGYSKAVNRGIIMSKGEYILLLNNDTILLDQPKDLWLDILLKPFELYNNCGLSGPLVLHNHNIHEDFLVFFCVLIKRELFGKLGLLDESFGWGAGEDTAFCIEARRLGYRIVQVPDEGPLQVCEKQNVMVAAFPIYHKGELTVHTEVKDWDKNIEKNDKILLDRYGK